MGKQHDKKETPTQGTTPTISRQPIPIYLDAREQPKDGILYAIKMKSGNVTRVVPVLQSLTPIEAARISAHVYGDHPDNILTGGWKASSRNFSQGKNIVVLNDPYGSGFKSRVYERIVNGKVTEYVYAFAGTEDLRDAVTDIHEGSLGLFVKQYEQAAKAAKAISDELVKEELNSDELSKKKSKLSFVGHSLGGGLAAYCLAETGTDRLCTALTFNALGVSRFTKLSMKNAAITAYVLTTDPLNMIQNNNFTALGVIMADVDGKIVRVKTPEWVRTPIQAHSIDTMIEALDPTFILTNEQKAQINEAQKNFNNFWQDQW